MSENQSGVLPTEPTALVILDKLGDPSDLTIPVQPLSVTETTASFHLAGWGVLPSGAFLEE